MRKITTLALAVLMLLMALAGCGNGSGSGSGAPASPGTGSAPDVDMTGEPYEVNFVYLVASTGTGMDRVRDAVNELALRELNMTVNLIPMTFGEFMSQLPMMLASNETLDLFPIGPGLVSTYIESQYIVNAADYLDYVGNVKDVVGETMIEAGYIGDFLAGFPIVKEAAMPVGLAVRKDIFDDLGYSVDDFSVTTDDMSTFDQITDLFAAVKEAYPEMTALDGTVIMGTQMFAAYADGMGDNFGGLENYGSGTTVTNIYESDMFRDFCEIAKTWYDLGYTSKDIAVNTDSGEIKMKSGNTFSIMLGYKPNTATEKYAQTGYEVEIIPLCTPMKSTASVAIYGVANSSKDPAKAVQFFNWAYGSGEFADLINWGVEGVDWVEAEDGTARYPDGIDTNNVSYHQDMGWMYPNQFAGHVWEGNDPDVLEQYRIFNDSAFESKAFGFTFDSTGVVDEIIQLTAIEEQYRNDLAYGVVDIESGLKTFNDALYAAGLQRVMDEKQRQFDEWLAAQ